MGGQGMGDAKTTITDIPVEMFIEAVEPPAKREDARVLDALFHKVTGKAPKMWGPTIIGYGEYSTTYDSGRKVHWLRIGFSPRKTKHSLYLSAGCDTPDDEARRTDALGRLGKFSQGTSCLYVNKLADIDLGVLEEMIADGWAASLRNLP
jgi:Domain of unknown function (DU1801)